ncbi:putative histone-lysine N-methyltransferase (Ash1) [Aspergillus nomiae NRRL 13137]|uniref:Putative histone-lysine N-methyltransferase (Ash1) n=1 Tax=Aspergillus nomiae NRRL (strain ATCC 15546 / NRRL 13137 / CBS 260.88 / M93) TaxID=1509407 RepID=A0A0L1J2A2_ASPN3|nr:putative histone-lysine N-methyltransferase (Ash1) [Aspergillus nomiae NRRL 13137]KNG85872.1 putative histone-lysine N-methyltransferase (Ash1) [Aspergillus nomiae NRRL 13137]
MESQLSSAGAPPATPATLSDLNKHAHEPADDTMAFEYSEQLLTPENSRSETSSNNENASTEEKPTARRRSTRVTRASLRGEAQLDGDMEIDNQGTLSTAGENDSAVSEEALLDKAEGGKRSQASHLRHSIAVMESWSEATLAQDNMETEGDHPMAPDTPVSKSSQELQASDMGTSLQQRTLRKRVERILTEEGGSHKGKITETAKETKSPVRRSSRLSLLEKASDLVGRASSILGKRSRDVVGKGKELGRRASLRPRITAPKEEPVKAASEAPAAKKRRVSESDLPAKIQENEDTEQEAPKPVTRSKTKRWLAHGLYTGQEYTESRPLQSRNRNAKRRSQGPTQRRLLPMPMFAGDRLLKQGRDFELPFDIFSPLPSGQPKPNEWRKTNKNVFVGEASSIWRANKPLELSKCMCAEETGCDEECQNRYMFYECDDSNCGVGPECGNRNFEELKQRTKVGGKYNIGVEVIKTEDRGYGVRSNRTFEPNQVIVEYTGEIITQAECEKRMRTIYKKNECYYLMYFDQNMIIDATRGSIARFVNHSCEPNCRMEKWTVAGKPRMALFAGDRGIMTGDELTYDYNFDPYSQKNVQQCRCGSDRCRGILGPRPREKEQRSKEKELRAENEKKSSSKNNNKKASITKQKVLSGSTSRVNKRQLLGPKSIKSGVKKVVSKARSSASKATTTSKTSSKTSVSTKATKTTSKKAIATPARRQVKKDNARSKKEVKLPKVKTTKTKARKPMQTTKTQSAPSTSKLSRPSEKTKAKILQAAKGTNTRKRTVKKEDTKTKSPAKRTSKVKESTLRGKTASKAAKNPKA